MFHNLKQKVWCSVMTWRVGLREAREGGDVCIIMASSHCCTLAWKIPWMEEPGRLQSMGSLRVGHD